MKTLIKIAILGLISTSSLAGNAPASYSSDDGFMLVDVNSTHPLDLKILEARNGAIEAIELAKNDPTMRTNQDFQRLFVLMMAYLKNTPIQRGVDKTAENLCNKKNSSTSLYVPTKPYFRRVIRVCKSADHLTTNALKQAFVHESFHLFERISNEGDIIPYSEERSEALATKYELIVMRYAYGCSHFNNAYFNKPAYQSDLAELQVKKLNLCKDGEAYAHNHDHSPSKKNRSSQRQTRQ